MEELYRYILVRPSEAVDKQRDSDQILSLIGDDDFSRSIINSENQAARKSVADTYLGSRDFITPDSPTPLLKSLVAISDEYRAVSLSDSHPILDVLTKVSTLLQENSDQPPPSNPNQSDLKQWIGNLIEQESWRSIEKGLRNSILAIRESHRKGRSLYSLVEYLRAMRLVVAIADDSNEEVVRPGVLMKATLYTAGTRRLELPNRVTDDELERTSPKLESNKLMSKRLSKAICELEKLPLSHTRLDVTETRTEVNESETEDRRRIGRLIKERVVRQVKVTPEAVTRMSEETRQVFVDLDINVDAQPLDAIVDAMRSQEHTLMAKHYSGSAKIFKGTKLKKFLTSTKTLDSMKIPKWLNFAFVPKTTGNVAPVGIGDLLIVKQHLKRYEGGDIAHIENILQGETKEREHRRRHLSESIFVKEEETEVSEERETQTTDRFEMQLETQQQVSEEFGVGAGVKISASYGPTVDVEANTDFSYKNAKSESHSRAMSMSKELVEKAANKYRAKVRSQVTRRLVDEVEETNRHTLDASGASGHIIGIYQWLNKIYEAQIYNYGLRVMYDFMVPEPAAYYIWALNASAEEEEALIVPPAFTLSGEDQGAPLSAKDVSEYNYQELVARYDALDVSAPPEPYISIAVNKSATGDPEFGTWQDSEKVVIPDGYEYYLHTEDKMMTVHAGMGDPFLKIEMPSLYQDPGTIPVVFIAQQIVGGAAYVHIKCRRTETALNNWRNAVWQALHDGHEQQIRNYEEKLAAVTTQEGIEIQGRNPHLNRRTERAELKKSCISLLTGTYPSWLNGISDTIIGPVPKANESSLQGAYVRFIEQAFEWENMTYLFYPYFWARSGKWLELSAVEDIDPLFQDFLRAGYARVVVPVRPGFEETVEHFRQTGKIWKGGKLPDITDEDYLPIALEMKALLDAPGDETPVGNPWDVLVPTQLVKLRESNDLPRWEKQDDGSWQEA